MNTPHAGAVTSSIRPLSMNGTVFRSIHTQGPVHGRVFFTRKEGIGYESTDI